MRVSEATKRDHQRFSTYNYTSNTSIMQAICHNRYRNMLKEMTIRKSIGRPHKVDYRIMIMLADSIQHNSTITEACRYTGISRDTFYRYMKTQPVFAEKIALAKQNQNKVPMSFLTTY